jgi:hypothetical protein
MQSSLATSIVHHAAPAPDVARLTIGETRGEPKVFGVLLGVSVLVLTALVLWFFWVVYTLLPGPRG